MKVKLLLEYDGSAFSGWQRQSNQATVQGELEHALQVYLQSLEKEQPQVKNYSTAIVGSGRTDAGVHARGQVAHFEWPAWACFDAERLCAALNGISSKALAVRFAELVPDSFDARRSEHRKCYSYALCCRRSRPVLNAPLVLHVGRSLNIEAMCRAAMLFRGTHDFKSFQASDCSARTTTRTIYLSEFTQEDHHLLIYRVIGKGFLKQMVRAMVGTLLQVGYGELRAEDISRILAAKDRSIAGPTAPAQGLTLEWVRY